MLISAGNHGGFPPKVFHCCCFVSNWFSYTISRAIVRATGEEGWYRRERRSFMPHCLTESNEKMQSLQIPQNRRRQYNWVLSFLPFSYLHPPSYRIRDSTLTLLPLKVNCFSWDSLKAFVIITAGAITWQTLKWGRSPRWQTLPC